MLSIQSSSTFLSAVIKTNLTTNEDVSIKKFEWNTDNQRGK